MEDVLTLSGGHWVRAQTADDGPSFGRLSKTLVEPYIRIAFGRSKRDGVRSEFYGYVSGAGADEAMPVVLMIEHRADREPNRLVSGYRNTDPYPNYGKEIAALAEHVGVPLPPECFPYRGTVSDGRMIVEGGPGHETAATPRGEDFVKLGSKDLVVGGWRWVEIRSDADMAFFSKLGEVDLLQVRAGKEPEEATYYALADNGIMIFTATVFARIPSDGDRASTTGRAGQDPTDAFRDEIQALEAHLGVELPYEDWTAGTAPKP